MKFPRINDFIYLFIYLFIVCVCRVGLKFPTIEVRYTNLCVEAECELVRGKPLPTPWNSCQSTISVSSSKMQLINFRLQN